MAKSTQKKWSPSWKEEDIANDSQDIGWSFTESEWQTSGKSFLVIIRYFCLFGWLVVDLCNWGWGLKRPMSTKLALTLQQPSSLPLKGWAYRFVTPCSAKLLNILKPLNSVLQKDIFYSIWTISQKRERVECKIPDGTSSINFWRFLWWKMSLAFLYAKYSSLNRQHTAA